MAVSASRLVARAILGLHTVSVAATFAPMAGVVVTRVRVEQVGLRRSRQEYIGVSVVVGLY